MYPPGSHHNGFVATHDVPNRTSCAQVHELPQNHCGDKREGTLFSWLHIYVYIYIFLSKPFLWLGWQKKCINKTLFPLWFFWNKILHLKGEKTQVRGAFCCPIVSRNVYTCFVRPPISFLNLDSRPNTRTTVYIYIHKEYSYFQVFYLTS